MKKTASQSQQQLLQQNFRIINVREYFVKEDHFDKIFLLPLTMLLKRSSEKCQKRVDKSVDDFTKLNESNGQDKGKEHEVPKQEAKLPKRTYNKRQNQTPTLTSINDLIEVKRREKEALQAEIEKLITKRNELFFNESEGLGLIGLMTDPEKAKWLADIIKESTVLIMPKLLD